MAKSEKQSYQVVDWRTLYFGILPRTATLKKAWKQEQKASRRGNGASPLGQSWEDVKADRRKGKGARQAALAELKEKLNQAYHGEQSAGQRFTLYVPNSVPARQLADLQEDLFGTLLKKEANGVSVLIPLGAVMRALKTLEIDQAVYKEIADKAKALARDIPRNATPVWHGKGTNLGQNPGWPQASGVARNLYSQDVLARSLGR